VWTLLRWEFCHGDLIDGTSNTRPKSKFWWNRQVCIFVLSVPLCSFSGFWSLENIFPAIVQLPKQTKLIRVSVFKIYYRDMMYEIRNASFCQDDENKLTIVKCCLILILKESLVLSFFVECFLMFIFSVLVSWKRDITTSIPLPI